MTSDDLTNEQAEALGRRWLAAGGRWRDGMATGNGHPRRMLFNTSSTGATYGYALPLPVRKGIPRRPPCPALDREAWPDLRDPATRGACLAVVRERWGDSAMHLRPVASGWGAFTMRVSLGGDAPAPLYLCVAGATEAEALVDALESHPTVTP